MKSRSQPLAAPLAACDSVGAGANGQELSVLAFFRQYAGGGGMIERPISPVGRCLWGFPEMASRKLGPAKKKCP